MTKSVIDVGNCGFDHRSLRKVIETHFDAQLIACHSVQEAISLLQAPCDLVLVNRLFDSTGGRGMELIEQMKRSPELEKIPVMLISNYAESQAEAIAAGALPGFGKNSLHSTETLQRLEAVLSNDDQQNTT